MSVESFREGLIHYSVVTADSTVKLKEHLYTINLNEWTDGCVAFPRGEKRLADMPKDIGIEALAEDEVKSLVGIDGYLMEVDVWREKAGVYEEIAVEREDRGWFCQKWTLRTGEFKGASEGYFPCYWRVVETMPISKGLFKNRELTSVEVVVPEERLHFFITKGGRNEDRHS